MELLEIEIKAYCDNPEDILTKLTKLGSMHVNSAVELDLYFNHPSRDFKTTDEALRLRQVGNSIILTYKGPKIGQVSKTRFEQEVQVSDYAAALDILKRLGFVEAGSIKKTRDKYILDDIEICIDRVDGLGVFVELEAKSGDHVRVEEKLFSIARDLGLTKFERRSYLELKYAK